MVDRPSSVSIVAIVTLLLCGLTAAADVPGSAVRHQPPTTERQQLRVITVDGLRCGSAIGIVVNESNQRRTAVAPVANFRGIPYATPPLGDLRFAPPMPDSACFKWGPNKVFNATQFGGFCVQPDGLGWEDCLVLNVQTPVAILTRSNRSQLFPVSFYIHGGNLVEGSGNFEDHGSFAAFAGGDAGPGVVAVTINYRLGVLGFLALPANDSSAAPRGNFGIQDQLLALQWVRDNIRAFGGDPDRVTIAGQSSGGTSVFALMSSRRARGLFRAAISFSGSPNITMDATAKLAQDAGIVHHLGCDGGNATTDGDSVKCLRALDAASVARAMPTSWNTPGIFHLEGLSPTVGRNYAGIVFVDGDVVSMPFRDALQWGLNGNVTLVMSNLGQEGNLVSQHGDVHAMNTTAWKVYLENVVFREWPNRTAARLADDVFASYREEAAVNPLLAYDSIAADYGLSCANVELAVEAKRRGAFTAPIYLSVNQWPPSFPDDNRQLSYAYHLWDYQMAIMRSFDLLPDEHDFMLGDLVRLSWYAILATGRAPPSWLEVSARKGFPDLYNTFVYSRPDRFPFHAESRTWVRYKSAQCGVLRSYGFDQRFWWCD